MNTRQMINAARLIAATCDIGWDKSPGTYIKYSGNLNAVESLVHELAHAALLKLPLKPSLSNDISRNINSLAHENCHEIDTLGAEIDILRRFCLPVNEEAFLLEAQDQTQWSFEDTRRRWSYVRGTHKYAQAVEAVVDLFTVYSDVVREPGPWGIPS